jgi:hypothetical protein
MKMPPFIARLLIAATLAATSIVATATPAAYLSRSSFESASSPTSLINYGFDDINTIANGFLHVANPFETHGIKYSTGGNNWVLNLGTGGVTNNVFTSDAPIGSAGFVSGAFADSSNYSMFGLDLGSLGGASRVNISLVTNLGTYDNFYSFDAPEAPASSFLGFAVGTGEYFRSFSIVSATIDTAPTLDNVTVGLVLASPAPEPGIISGLAAGLMLLGFVTRRRDSKPA